MTSTSTYAIMYLEINLISTLIVAVIGFKTNGISKMVAQRNFSNAINAQVLFFLSDTMYVMMSSGLLPYSRRAALLSKTIYFFSTALMCYFWFVYFEHMQGSEFIRSRRKARASSVLVWVMVVFLIINLFNGMLFYVDGDNVYHRGKLFITSYLLSYIYVFIASFHALVGIFDKRKIQHRKTLIYLSLFPLTPAGAGIIQFIRPELPLACATLSIATLIMYLNWTDEMISVDPLTKLNNRKQLNFYYGHWLKQDDRTPLTLMMIDANKFKSINDTYGHVQGDAALTRIANALLLACHECDERYNIARYGGDEFTVLIHTHSEEKITALKASINRHLEILNGEAKSPYELTVSIGCAKADDAIALKDLIETADEMLYEEKRKTN